uniref:Invertebrate defensins family profile domain-containing protein n=1 Tax=Bionectria ochroleuca TaxID=29856 RepID=A0A8H7TW93_BIOOC
MHFTQALAIAILGLASSSAALPSDPSIVRDSRDTGIFQRSTPAKDEDNHIFARAQKCGVFGPKCPVGMSCLGGRCVPF